MGKKRRVADIVADFIVNELSTESVFTVTGGGAMFLNDGVASNPHLKAICNHHEQASAMAAVGYAKSNNGFGVCMPTTGCGSTNTITGLLDAWQDNVKCFFISGQVKSMQTSRNHPLPLRQLGVQEVDIISVVESLTKFSIMIDDPSKIFYYLEKAKYLCETGRPGPVWIDIPMDFQGAIIDPDECIHFDASEIDEDFKKEISSHELTELEKKISSSKRPILFAGNGIKLAGAISELQAFVETFKIPVVATFLGIDVLETGHDLMIGRSGIKGDRAGNFALANADLIIAVGNRLSVPSTGFEFDLFAREAEIVVIDIDPVEHRKETVNIDQFINADARSALKEMLTLQAGDTAEWCSKCLHWKKKWPVNHEIDHEPEGMVNLYHFMYKLNQYSKPETVFVSDAGSSFYVMSQGINIKKSQNYVTSGGQADMGFTLPAAIGASEASPGRQIVGITGDGSFQMNIQELQTLVQNNYPVKLIVWNNNGYLSIRATQRKFFESRFMGVDSTTGVSFPSVKKIAEAYGIPYFYASTSPELDSVFSRIMDIEGPVLFEVQAVPDQEIIPNVSALKKTDGTMVSKPIEDMYPFLTREEFDEEMIIKPV